MNALTVVFAALCIFAIGYRFYGLFIANKELNLNDARVTPAVKYSDGHDYVDTNKYVLFGHHFAAIAAAGPLLGPVLAAQFGYMPGLLWILIGCVLAGGVHDMVVLFASVRHRGQSLAYIASQEIDKTTGSVAAWAVLAILLLTLAGLSIAVVNAIGTAVFASSVGGGGLGNLINTGIRRNDVAMILSGTAALMAMALLLDGEPQFLICPGGLILNTDKVSRVEGRVVALENGKRLMLEEPAVRELQARRAVRLSHMQAQTV